MLFPNIVIIALIMLLLLWLIIESYNIKNKNQKSNNHDIVDKEKLFFVYFDKDLIKNQLFGCKCSNGFGIYEVIKKDKKFCINNVFTLYDNEIWDENITNDKNIKNVLKWINKCYDGKISVYNKNYEKYSVFDNKQKAIKQLYINFNCLFVDLLYEYSCITGLPIKKLINNIYKQIN